VEVRTVFIVDAWKGRDRLWRVFWLYGVLTSALITGVFLWLISSDTAGFGLRQLLLAAFVPYTAWILVSVWRCAFNARNEVWGHIARALTIAWAINASLLVVFAELDLIL
jgi:hypothetical protein